MATKFKSQKELIGGFNDELVETGAELGKHVKNEVVGGLSKDAVAQLLGIDITSTFKNIVSHEYGAEEAAKVGPEAGHHGTDKFDIFIAANHAADKETKRRLAKGKDRIDPGIDYHSDMLRSGDHALRRAKAETNHMVQELKGEMEALSKAVNKMGTEFASVSTEQAPVDGGEYHKHFFEWMLSVIKNARAKVEEAGTWMSAGAARGAKKADYSAANGKMHQSGERTTVQNAAG
jgi:hypothetical protein